MVQGTTPGPSCPVSQAARVSEGARAGGQTSHCRCSSRANAMSTSALTLFRTVKLITDANEFLSFRVGVYKVSEGRSSTKYTSATHTHTHTHTRGVLRMVT